MSVTERAAVVADEARGAEIQRRRMNLRLDSINQFHEASGFSRDILTKAERGVASDQKMKAIELWLDRMEAGVSGPVQPPQGAVRVTLHGVFGVGDAEVVFDGNTPAEEMAEKMRAIIEALKPSTPGQN